MPRTPVEMFDVRRARDADAAFVLTPDGALRTYGDIGARAHQLAGVLSARGVRPGDFVGLYLANDPAWVVAVLATWWCGAVVAACGTVSPSDEATRRFELVSPRVVLTGAETTIDRRWPRISLTPEGLAEDSATGHVDRVLPEPHDLAAVFFTSGTTGASKAIAHTHLRLAEGPRATASAYASSADFRPRVAPVDRPPAISFTPFGHLAGLNRLIFRMYVGRPLLIVPKFEVEVMRTLAARYPLDTLQLTPAMVHSLAYADGDIDLGALKYVTSGTAPLPAATRDAFERRFGVPVLQAYGSTEGGVTALERYEDAVAGRRGPGSVGRVTEGSVMRIVDPVTGREVRAGEEGEILGQPDPARTGRYVTEDGDEPLPVDAEGWYHTGDLGRVDEHGILYVTGRLKEMMIVGGFNVFPAEVEDAIRRCAGVRDAAVVPLPDDRLGEIPVAAIVWADEGRAVDELEREVRTHLAAYKVPRRWFAIDALPLTPNGKLDRRRVGELAGGAGAGS